MDISRRNFLKNASIISLGFVGLDQLVLSSCQNEDRGIGPLQYKDGDILRLPEGFTAKIISQKGDLMDDGFFTPGAFDGMGTFKFQGNKIILIRNHEITPGHFSIGPYGKDNDLLPRMDIKKVYDYASGSKSICLGGTTTLIYNEKSQEVEKSYLSLTGTVRNCAGGITPWNSWITCEETDLSKGDEEGLLDKDHGYAFEIPATDNIGLIDPVPIKAMGRFVREAVAVHPLKGIVYQTEDDGEGIFYRFIPNKPGDLHQGGRLQCLAISGWDKADTRNYKHLTSDPFPEKKSFNVHWIDLEDVESPDGDLRYRGFDKGAARFSSAEGIWYGKDELFFACTNGGRIQKGQIFKYIPSKYEGEDRENESPGKLELFLEPNNTDIFQWCDNLTIAPWGDVIICEDKADARIVGITPRGETYVIAQNVKYRESEFAGPVFSPSGKTLFINVQSPGVTLAITGNWKK